MESRSVVLRACDGECGGFIPAKRLTAKPNARFCFACQERRDTRITDERVNLARLHTIPEGSGDLPTTGHSRTELLISKLRTRGLLSTAGL